MYLTRETHPSSSLEPLITTSDDSKSQKPDLMPPVVATVFYRTVNFSKVVSGVWRTTSLSLPQVQICPTSVRILVVHSCSFQNSEIILFPKNVQAFLGSCCF